MGKLNKLGIKKIDSVFVTLHFGAQPPLPWKRNNAFHLYVDTCRDGHVRMRSIVAIHNISASNMSHIGVFM